MDFRERESDIAAAIVERADREHPADAVLRAELREHHDLMPDSKRAIAQRVFAYFRWLGWLGQEGGLASRIRLAMELQERFRRDPKSIPEEELRSRAVPDWVSAAMEVPAEWLTSLQREPFLWLRARPGQGAELARRLGGCRVRPEAALGDCLQYAGTEDLFTHPDFHAGQFELQDLSSQLVGLKS